MEGAGARGDGDPALGTSWQGKPCLLHPRSTLGPHSAFGLCNSDSMHVPDALENLIPKGEKEQCPKHWEAVQGNSVTSLHGGEVEHSLTPYS